MYFETAGIYVSFWLPPLVAFLISFFTSMGGISGAFLLLPFQMSVLGYTAPSVSATNQLFNVVAIPSGVLRYIKEGRMVWPLTAVVIAGTLPGVVLGAVVRIKYLPDPNNFRLSAAAVLLYIGVRVLRDLMRAEIAPTTESAEQRFHESVKRGRNPDPRRQRESATRLTAFDGSYIEYEFYGDKYRASTGGIYVLCMLAGIIGGIYGIGGGSIVAPLFIAFFRLPVYTIAGATLMGTFVTSVAGVAFYQALSGCWPSMSIAPDWKLGALFGVGGAAGMYLGARCQRFVPATLIKWMLAGILVFTAGRYVWAFVAAVGD
jgi:uncharacterized membrane protein YfcA